MGIWGETYNRKLAQGHDHGSAAYEADRAANRAEKKPRQNTGSHPDPLADPIRLAFMAGWWVNAATPGVDGAGSREYFEGCAESDWQEYQRQQRPAPADDDR